jgi:hypothetical protein
MRNKRDRSARTRSGFAIAAACAAFAFCAGRAHAQSGAALQAQLIREYVDTFSPHGMVAVLIPIGQQAGDVLDKLGEELVHRRQECFANLAPQESPSSLPNFDLGASAAFRLGLGLDKIADADLKAVGENRVILRFEDVTVQTISFGRRSTAKPARRSGAWSTRIRTR